MAPVTTDIQVLLLNAENLFLLSDQPIMPDHLKLDAGGWRGLSTSIYENKPLHKLREFQSIIEKVNPDILLLCEIGGLESLQNFNRLFLGDRYSPALVEGNSDRNIDVGFLIKREKSFYFDLISNKTKPINYLYPHERQTLDTGMPADAKIASSHRFSRDAAELHLFLHDREKPFFVFIMTHLKSRLDRDRIDPNGAERRAAEAQTLIEIYNTLEARFGGSVPIAVGGDYNGNASRIDTDTEFLPLYKTTGLEDVCELAGIAKEDRATFYQVGRSRQDGRQIDYCFLSPKAQGYLDKTSVQVYRYQDKSGMRLDPPTTLEAKDALPSDHYPLVFRFRDVPVR